MGLIEEEQLNNDRPNVVSRMPFKIAKVKKIVSPSPN